MLTTVRRIRGRSPDELRVRGMQALHVLLERFGAPARGAVRVPPAQRLAPGVPTTPDALLAGWRAAHGTRALPGALRDPVAAVDALRRHAPGDEALVVARAERLLAGRFDLLGYTGLDFGQPVDWQLDPVAGRRAPLRHWSSIPYLDHAVVGDHKVVWEVNRQQWLVTLAQAYRYTADERYARSAARHLAHWLDANPPKLGVNWASSLEVAYRAIAWTWALQLLRPSPHVDAPLFDRALASLDLHGRHVERYLSTYFSPNTHLTGEALGLAYLGAAWPELRQAPRWWAWGRDILLAQLDRQVRPDGTYFEQASQYHRYTTEIYLHLLLLAERQGDAATADRVRPVLGRLAEHLRWITRPDGEIPLFGDDDGGRLLPLDACPARDVRGLLAILAVVCGRPSLAHGMGAAVAPESVVAPAIWLLGDDPRIAALADAPAPAAPPSRAFPDGGFYVMRDRWTPDAAWAVVDCGPHGVMNCGHAHADALALELSAGGQALLVDSGTYSYPGTERNDFRHTRAHNAVTVDGASSSDPAAGAFQWRTVARCTTQAWVTTDAVDYLAGSHDGFARLPDPVSYAREVLFVKGDAAAGRPGYWVVRDRITAAAEHLATVHWHAAVGLDARSAGTVAELSADGAGRLRLAAFASAAGAWQVRPGWVSDAYGAREAAPVAVWEQRAVGAQEIVTFLLPADRAGGLPEVAEVAASGGRAFRVAGAWGTDVVLAAADGMTVDGAGVRTDAAWAVAREVDAGGVRVVDVVPAAAHSPTDDATTRQTTSDTAGSGRFEE